MCVLWRVQEHKCAPAVLKLHKSIYKSVPKNALRSRISTPARGQLLGKQDDRQQTATNSKRTAALAAVAALVMGAKCGARHCIPMPEYDDGSCCCCCCFLLLPCYNGNNNNDTQQRYEWQQQSAHDEQFIVSNSIIPVWYFRKQLTATTMKTTITKAQILARNETIRKSEGGQKFRRTKI